MCFGYLGFVLLIWFPAVLHAQSAAQPCSAPRLDGGFFAPKQETYSHESKLTYTCDNGRKPAVKGWWATSTCQNGKWSHEPQCVDEGVCLPPEIPNAKYTENPNGWYEDGRTIRITCDQGYEPKNQVVTARCINGTWSSVSVCEKSIQACSEPPKIPHAVIIHQEYKEVFAVDSEVQYECEDGYTAEGADSKKSIICIAGNWTEGPSCRTRPGTGHGGSTVGGTGGGTRPAAYCEVNTDDYPELKPVGGRYLEDGESSRFECKDLWMFPNYSVGRCTDGRMTFTRCCNKFQLSANTC